MEDGPGGSHCREEVEIQTSGRWGPYRQASPPPARHRPGARSARRERCPTRSIADHIAEEIPMWFNNFFKALTSTSSRRRPTHRPAARLYLEPLEDRRLLNFGPAVTYPGGTGALATADFNNDTRLDLAVVNNNNVSVLLGNADGTFQSPLNSPAGGGGIFAVGDFNADGRPDLVVGGSVQLGNGNGTFAAPIYYYMGYSPLSAVTAGDFN